MLTPSAPRLSPYIPSAPYRPQTLAALTSESLHPEGPLQAITLAAPKPSPSPYTKLRTVDIRIYKNMAACVTQKKVSTHVRIIL